MRRAVSAMVVLLVLSSGIGSVALTASAADIAIQANSSADEPAPGEPFTLSVNLTNLGNESVEVTSLYVRDSDSDDEYARASNLGSLAAGGEMNIPMSVTIDDTGRKRLTVYATVRDSAGEYTRVSYPVYVNVEEPDETSVSFSGLDPVAGDQSTVNVTVANGDSGTLSNVQLELGGDATVEDPERLNASLASGSQVTYTYEVMFPDAGEGTLEATLTYKTDDGTTRTVTREVTTDVEAANVDTGLTATATAVNGSSAIRAALTEYGNVELRDVQVSAVVDGETVARTLADDVTAEGTHTVLLDGSDIPAGEVTVVAQYTAAGEQRTTETTLDYSPSETANVTLTGVEVTQSGSSLTLSGDAANLGTEDASSVLLSVAEDQGVSPDSSGGEYFVGTIESSEFATFELTANAMGNATVDSVPIRISYTADGERVSQVVDVDVSNGNATGGFAAAAGESGSGDGAAAAGPGGAGGPPSGAGGPPGAGGSSGLPLIEIGIVLAVVVIGIAGFGVYRWRQQS